MLRYLHMTDRNYMSKQLLHGNLLSGYKIDQA